MLIRKSGVAGRVADLRIDTAARQAALAVRQAGNEGATERFLSRFLDHLHDVDASPELSPLQSPDMTGSTRRPRRPG